MHIAFLDMFGPTSILSDRAFLVSMVMILVIFWLCLLRNISALENGAYLSILIIVVFSITVCYRGLINLGSVKWIEVHYFVTTPEVFDAFPLICGAFSFQSNIFPVYNELTDPSRAKMFKIIKFALTFSGVLYVCVALLGYLPAGNTIQSDYLNTLPSTTPYDVLRIAFAIALIPHYAIAHYALRKSVEHRFFLTRGFAWKRHITETVVVCALSTFFAIELPNLGKVFAFTGAFAAFPIMFIYPLLFYLKLVRRYNDSDSLSMFYTRLQDATPRTGASKLQSNALGYAPRKVLFSQFLLVFAVVSCIVSIIITGRNLSA